jgi:NAD(P)-dependent dehydrogenase (short-subunit alcohol dehydrogenase family)
MSLTNESVVVITGAASGIGRALAIRLAREPIAGIAIADVNQEGLAETARLINKPNPRVTTHVVNVADEEQMRAFVEEVTNQHERVTHVINNAGVALGGNVRDVSLDDIRWLMSINFWGVVYGTKLFLPVLEKQKSAHIVNVSSVFGLVAPPGQAAYAASKFAVRGFSEALRHELENTNISVSVVHPGGIKTNIANNSRIGAGVKLTEAERLEKIERFNKHLAATTPEQAAETIVKGIKARQSRIVIGSDARLLSLFGRLFPRRYYSAINFITGGKLKND